MDLELLKFLVCKAYKIYTYNYCPRTDEQYQIRKLSLLKAYKKTQKNYKRTSDKTYLTQMKNLRKSFCNNISETEYNLCKKIIEEYKQSYRAVISEDCWDYKSLANIYYNILVGNAKDVETAVELHKRRFEDIRYCLI